MMMWTVHLDGGPTRVNHAAVAIDDRIFSFGGYCSGEDYSTPRPMDVHMLNTVSLRWTLVPNSEDLRTTPYQRYGHTAVAYEDSAFIWGGRNDNKGPCNKLFQFTGATLKWSLPEVTGKIPKARDGHSSCIINHCMYIFAGYEEYSNQFSNDMNYIDLRTFNWVMIPTNGVPARWRDFHTGTAVGNTMYIFGGRCDEGGSVFTNSEIYCNEVMAFDTCSRTWSKPCLPLTSSLDHFPIGRRSHSAFVYKGHMYIFGGYNSIMGVHYNDLHALNLETMKWSEVKVPGNGPTPCRRQCCSVVGKKVYFFGGTSPRSKEPPPRMREDLTDLIDLSDLYILDLEPSLKTLASMAIIEHGLDGSDLPHDLRWELAVMTSVNKISPSNLNYHLDGVTAL